MIKFKIEQHESVGVGNYCTINVIIPQLEGRELFLKRNGFLTTNITANCLTHFNSRASAYSFLNRYRCIVEHNINNFLFLINDDNMDKNAKDAAVYVLTGVQLNLHIKKFDKMLKKFNNMLSLSKAGRYPNAKKVEEPTHYYKEMTQQSDSLNEKYKYVIEVNDTQPTLNGKKYTPLFIRERNTLTEDVKLAARFETIDKAMNYREKFYHDAPYWHIGTFNEYFNVLNGIAKDEEKEKNDIYTAYKEYVAKYGFYTPLTSSEFFKIYFDEFGNMVPCLFKEYIKNNNAKESKDDTTKNSPLMDDIVKVMNEKFKGLFHSYTDAESNGLNDAFPPMKKVYMYEFPLDMVLEDPTVSDSIPMEEYFDRYNVYRNCYTEVLKYPNFPKDGKTTTSEANTKKDKNEPTDKKINKPFSLAWRGGLCYQIGGGAIGFEEEETELYLNIIKENIDGVAETAAQAETKIEEIKRTLEEVMKESIHETQEQKKVLKESLLRLKNNKGFNEIFEKVFEGYTVEDLNNGKFI